MDTMLTQKRRICGGPPSSTLHWIAALHHGSNDVGAYLSSLVLQENAHGVDSSDDAMEEPTNGGAFHQTVDDKFLRTRIAAAGSLLAVIGYCCGRQGESNVTLPCGDTPLIDVMLASSAANLPCAELSADDKDGALVDVLAERDAAQQELKDSFALLSKELAGLSFATNGKRRSV